jgi:hypothetical protein
VAGEFQRLLAPVGNHCFETLVARQPDQHARVVWIVLDDEQHQIAFSNIVAVVRNLFLERGNGNGRDGGGRRSHGRHARDR